MFTLSDLPLLFVIIHVFLIIRFCVGSMFRPVGRPYSFAWLLLVCFLPYIGYYIYYRRYIWNSHETVHD